MIWKWFNSCVLISLTFMILGFQLGQEAAHFFHGDVIFAYELTYFYMKRTRMAWRNAFEHHKL